MTSTAIDSEISNLFETITKQKKEINDVEKHSWVTNCIFKFTHDATGHYNIQAIRDISILIKLLAFLQRESKEFNKIKKELDINIQYEHLGFTLEDWKKDIEARIKKINIQKEKTKLEQLEERLNQIISPEQKRVLELEAIKKELNKL